jgi:hypothetical protein
MTLKDQLNQDYKEAFKAKEEKKVSVLRLLSSAIKNKELEKRAKLVGAAKEGEDLEKASQLTDEEVLAVLGIEAKRRKDSIEQYRSGNREDLAGQEEAEVKILSVYLPEQMGEDEVHKLVKEAIAESGAASQQDLGKVMKVLMPRVKGKADGGMVNKIVKEELGN